MSFIEPEQGRTIGPEPVGPAPEAEVEVPVVEEAPAEPETFDREYVEKLRQENARYRTRAKEWDSVAGELADEDRQAWLEVIGLATSGDPDAINYLGEILGFTQEEAAAETPVEDQPQYLTREDAMALAREIAREEAQTLVSERDRVQTQQQQIQTIQSRAKDEFNIKPGSDDYVLLLKYANEIDPIDLPEGTDLLTVANEQLKANKQAQWDAFIASKEGQAANSPTTLSGNGSAPSTARVARSFAEARQMLDERLSNQG